MKERWKTGVPGTLDGWPVDFVSREEIDARFRGGWHLRWFLIKWRVQQIRNAFAELKKAFS